MLKDTRAQLLGRHLPSGESLEGELAVLASLPAEKQIVVEERLRVIDRYLAGDRQRPADADAAAAEIGVARQRFYRLIAKVREVGPVRALSPGFRNAPRVAPSKDGLPEQFESVIIRALRRQPDAKIATIEQLVRAEGARTNVAAPSRSAIKRRVHALRRSGIAPLNAPLGERLAMDQLALDLPVRFGSKTTLSVVTMLIDVNTRLVCGVALGVGDGIGLGVQSALSDSRKRTQTFKGHSLLVAEQISEFTWIVPPGLEYARDALEVDHIDESRRPILKVVGSGPRRHGDAILRLMGDKLGPHSFRRLPELGQDPPRSEAAGIDFDDAARLVRYSIDHWNAGILRRLPQFERDANTEEAAAARLCGIFHDLDLMFAPVFDLIEARQRDSRLRMREPGDHWS